MTLKTPFYNPNKSYRHNFKYGPFGSFAGDRGEPKFELLGHKIHLPFGIPAGPLLNANFVKAAFAKNFDICVYKTVRTSKYPCHPKPNVLRVETNGDLTLEKAAGELVASDNYSQPLSITNSFGVPSEDPDWWQADMRQAVAATGKGQVLIGSFQGTKQGGDPKNFIADYVLAARLVKETGAPILIANLSCPNEGTADLLCFDVEMVTKISLAIKKEIGNTPLLLKLAYFKDQKLLKKLVKKTGRIVDGYVAINTIPSTIVDAQGKPALPGKGRERSGVCGAGVKWAGLDMTSRLVELREKNKMKFEVIGVGGVMTPADFVQYRKKGASAVLSATGAMWNGELAEEIIKDQNQELKSQQKIAHELLKIKAVRFVPDKPITFKSGIISPVYVDNRKLPFYPTSWEIILDSFLKLIKDQKLEFDVVAGIESAGIPHSAALGLKLSKPSVFIRKKVKDHGTKSMIEGGSVAGKKVLLIEDHVTTGGSSLAGVEAIRNEGGVATDCLCITNYDFPESRKNFEDKKVKLWTLANFEVILEEQKKLIGKWFDDPWGWDK